MGKTQYDADSITVLEGLEAVRKRPGMYIGSVGTKGLNHLIYEIVDNSVDEHLAGACSQIRVTLEADGSCTVRDNGRGIPVEMHKKGVAAERIVLSTLHAGGKFDNNAYKTSGGLHGVGSSVVNALSAHLEVNVYKNGQIHHDAYERGIPTVELINGLLPVVGKTRETGTEINFLPDPEIFEKTRFKADWLKSRLHETAYLNPKLTILYENKRAGEAEKVTYSEPDGIVAYVRELNSTKTPIHDPIYFKGVSDQIEVEVAFQFVDAFEENVLGFCNNIFTQEGGTHLAGFKTRFTQMINNYAKELGILKEKDTKFTGPDTRNGMTAVVAVKHPDPIFEGQTKTKLASADATKAVFSVTGDELQLYFDRNLEVLKAIIACAEKSAKIRKAEERAKTNMLTKSRFSFDSNGKLANCESKDASKCEIFIVEGDSALGACKQARNPDFQAIMPIRGKILNCLKADYDKIFKSDIITDLMKVLGCGVEVKSKANKNLSTFDLSALRWNKVILCTDADVDGFQIRTLLLTMLYRLTPTLIEEGKVFIAESPLFEITTKDQTYFAYTEAEKETFLKQIEGQKCTIQRSKGLGENEPDMMSFTTMNPETRRLIQVMPEDAARTSEMFDLLLGDNLSGRKTYIAENGYLYIDSADVS